MVRERVCVALVELARLIGDIRRAPGILLDYLHEEAANGFQIKEVQVSTGRSYEAL
jgi:hypothetical protein